MPVTIIIIEKSGAIKESDIKTFTESDLYKKAGCKSAKGFELQTVWGSEIQGKTYSVHVYGKTNGRAGQENKYEFPPPIDTTLFFGSCILVNKVNGQPVSMSKTEWKQVYDYLYGGFEDLDSEDSEESEDDVDDNLPRTKEGYVKDDFIVDDNEVEDDDYETEVSSEEEIVAKPAKKQRKSTKRQPKKTIIKEESNNYLDCTSELYEEEYLPK